jgi:hypothetical protein
MGGINMANMQDFINAMENFTEYDFICNNGHRFTKDQLCTIIKELCYAIKTQEDKGIYFEASQIRVDAMECLQEIADEEERAEMYTSCY